MNQKVKTILASVLLVGGVGIWIPQLLAANKANKAMNIDEFPAEDDFRREGGFYEEETAGVLGLPVEDVDDPESEGPRASTGAIGKLEQLLGSGSTPTWQLSDLSAAWADEDEEADEGEGEEMEEEEEADEEEELDEYEASLILESVIEPPALEDPLQDFLAENALTGILVGKDKRVVSFGPYLFSEGEEILGSKAHITHVGQRHVILQYQGDAVRVDLPPFRSRTRRASLEASGDSGSLTEDARESEDVEAPAPEPLGLSGSEF